MTGRDTHTMERPPASSILDIVRHAGALVKTMQREVSLSVKQDGSVFTEADISSHALILRELTLLTPNIPVVSEEQSEAQSLHILHNAPLFWAVDPLDVTANYAAGGNTYSINVALVAHGVPVLGAIYFPGLEELYWCDEDGKAYKQIGKETPRLIHISPLRSGTQTAAVRPHDRLPAMPVADNTLKVIFTRGQRRACLVATGEATFCSEREGFRVWDSAATYAIVTAAGGALHTKDGGALRYDAALELPAYFVGHPELLLYLSAPATQEEAPTPTPASKRKKA